MRVPDIRSPLGPRRRRQRLALAVLLATCGAGAQAEPPDAEPEHLRYELLAGLEYSDNRLRRSDGAEADVLFVPQLNFSVRRHGDRWRARGHGEIGADLSLRRGRDDELRARLAAALDWSLLPERLYWTFQDYADVDTIDPLARDEPRNRAQTNVFVTGPVLTLGDRGGWHSRYEASYARGDAEDAPSFEHDRFSAGAWLLRADPVREWALGASSSDVDFRAPGDGADFRRHDLQLRFSNQLPRLGVELALGRSWIDRARQASSARPSLRGALRWAPGGDHEWRVRHVHELSDAGRDLMSGLDDAPLPAHVGRRWRLGADVYRLRESELGWTWRGLRSEWSLAHDWRDYDYLDETLALDRASRGVRGLARIALSPRSALRAQLLHERFAFRSISRRDRDLFAAIEFERRLAPRWSLRAGVSHYRRRSDATDAGYRENVASLFLVYAGQR